MTGLIAIDESGDLGSHGTRYFAIAVIVMLRPRNLKKAADLLPKDSERKWHNSLPQVREEVLSAMSDLRFNAVYTVVDKNNPSDHHPVYGNELYEKVLREVVSDAMDVLQCRDTNILLDGCRFISVDRLREICAEEAKKRSINLKNADKAKSDQNKCIQLVDFIAGASRARFEYGDTSIETIRDKISIARRR